MQRNANRRYPIFLFCPHFNRRKCAFLVIALLVYSLLYHLPGPPKTQNDTRADRPAPQYEVETKPRFLHHSQFRVHPDAEYERMVDKALKQIEWKTSVDHGGYAREVIWQVMLSKDSDIVDYRNPDSLLFEQKNPGWEYKLITTSLATTFLREIFSTIPDIVTTYNSYPFDVQRADLLRYLLLWYHGGFYADMDVIPVQPIKSCASLKPLFGSSTKLNISLVLGIEIDEPYASPQLMHDWHWIRRYEFIQFTMYAPNRFSPILRRVIVRVLAHTKQHHQSHSLLHWGKDRYDEEMVLEVTGPGVFTDAVLDVLSETLPVTHGLVMKSAQAAVGIGNPSWKRLTNLTWAPFYRLQTPMWIDASEAVGDMGGLGVLPVSVWGNGQRHSGAEGFDSSHACVNHRFARTWKKGWWEYFFG